MWLALLQQLSCAHLCRAQWLREHDQDGDKSITQSEYGGSADMWKLLDPDGDGCARRSCLPHRRVPGAL